MKGKGPQEGGGKQKKWLIHTLNVTYVPQDTKTTQEHCAREKQQYAQCRQGWGVALAIQNPQNESILTSIKIIMIFEIASYYFLNLLKHG